MGQNPWQRLLESEVSRRDFLVRVGTLLLMLTGISGILRTLSLTERKSQGYSSAAYGGERKLGRISRKAD
jgi:hypothetical protein